MRWLCNKLLGKNNLKQLGVGSCQHASKKMDTAGHLGSGWVPQIASLSLVSISRYLLAWEEGEMGTCLLWLTSSHFPPWFAAPWRRLGQFTSKAQESSGWERTRAQSRFAEFGSEGNLMGVARTFDWLAENHSKVYSVWCCDVGSTQMAVESR